MNAHRRTLPLTLIGLGLALAVPRVAQADEHPNMKILEHTGKTLKKSMKDFSKGLGVKCTSCHVKKDFDSEDKAIKDKTRPFFEATVGETDLSKRKAALDDLLELLKLEAPRDEGKLWKGIDAMEKKAS